MDPDPSSFLLMADVDYSFIIGLFVIVVLLICSALTSGCEVAFFSLKPTDFQDNNGKYTKKEQVIIRLLDKPQRLLATILVANNFINIATVLLFDEVGDTLFAGINASIFGVNLQFLLEVVVATFLLLLFGEILPKVYANRQNVKFAHFMAIPLSVLDKLLRVFTIPMCAFTKNMQHRLGNKNSTLSVDQLSQALDLADEDDTTKEEQEILQSIVAFGDTDTKQVMRPRMDIFALDLTQTYKAIIPEIIDHGYSRIPVYEESLDKVKGILYIKDLLPYLDEEDFAWQRLLRDPYFVPENKKLDDLLNEFKDRRNHLAIVVDEYGGTSGLISMEDIIEEIVGEISDEFDEDDLMFSKLDENTFVLDGKTSLIDFYKIIKIDDTTVFEDNKGESETIAGFLLEISGDFPKCNEVIKFENYTFAIEAVDEKRIKQIKFTRQ